MYIFKGNSVSSDEISLTIITVSLNSEKTIERCIDSIVPDLTDAIEYLIIDGGSCDNTLEIIKEKKQIYNIAYISEKDNGIYDAMNKGIFMAKGKWVWFVNSDDFVGKGLIPEILKDLKENDLCDFIYGDMEYVHNIRGCHAVETKRASDKMDKIKFDMVIGHPSTICKTDILKKFNGFDTKFHIAADWDLILRLFLGGCSYKHINKIYSRFYSGGVSASWHNYERHLVRKKNHTYKLIDLYYIKDNIKTFLWDLLSPVKDFLIKYRYYT